MDIFGSREYTEEELLRIARRRIRIKRSLYSHIASYIIVNGFLALIYFITGNKGKSFPWFLWVMVFWGMGLLIDIVHTIQNLRLTYNYGAVQKEVEKLKRYMKKDGINKHG